MKKMKAAALMAAICIGTFTFTGCGEIPEALMYASAPHISEDSELVTESMKIRDKFFKNIRNYVSFKSDESVESHCKKIDDIVNSGNYTLKTYWFSDWNEYGSDYYYDSVFPENGIDGYVEFQKEIVSNKDSWSIDGFYNIDKDQNPIIDKKTSDGAYYETIIKNGQEYFRSENARVFYASAADEFSYYDSTAMPSSCESLSTGKAVIGDEEYDAEVIYYTYDASYGYADADDEYMYYEQDDYYLQIYVEEDNLTIRIGLDEYDAKKSNIDAIIDIADFMIYEQNTDNSSIIQKPKNYINLDESAGFFY